MKVEDLIQLFNKMWSEEKSYLPKRRSDVGPIRGALKQQIYPLSQLPVLMKELQGRDDGSDEYDEEIFSVRYLVSRDKQLLFAREGRPDRFIPAHKQMRSMCLAAGNIFFSRDFKYITKINHQSGDFHPDPSSMVWPLAILSYFNASFADKLIIEESVVNAKGYFVVEALHEVPAVVLQKILTARLPENMVEINRSTKIEVSPQEKSPEGREKMSMRRKLTLDDGPSLRRAKGRRLFDLLTDIHQADLPSLPALPALGSALPAMDSNGDRSRGIGFSSRASLSMIFFGATPASPMPASVSIRPASASTTLDSSSIQPNAVGQEEAEAPETAIRTRLN